MIFFNKIDKFELLFFPATRYNILQWYISPISVSPLSGHITQKMTRKYIVKYWAISSDFKYIVMTFKVKLGVFHPIEKLGSYSDRFIKLI